MNFSIQELAQKKWFVPIIIIIIIGIAVSAFSPVEKGDSSENDSTKLKNLCIAITGTTNVNVMITYEDAVQTSFWSTETQAKRVSGVAVICDGGDNSDIKLKIYEVIKSLFGIPSTRISVSGNR